MLQYQWFQAIQAGNIHDVKKLQNENVNALDWEHPINPGYTGLHASFQFCKAEIIDIFLQTHLAKNRNLTTLLQAKDQQGSSPLGFFFRKAISADILAILIKYKVSIQAEKIDEIETALDDIEEADPRQPQLLALGIPPHYFSRRLTEQEVNTLWVAFVREWKFIARSEVEKKYKAPMNDAHKKSDLAQRKRALEWIFALTPKLMFANGYWAIELEKKQIPAKLAWADQTRLHSDCLKSLFVQLKLFCEEELGSVVCMTGKSPQLIFRTNLACDFAGALQKYQHGLILSPQCPWSFAHVKDNVSEKNCLHTNPDGEQILKAPGEALLLAQWQKKLNLDNVFIVDNRRLFAYLLNLLAAASDGATMILLYQFEETGHFTCLYCQRLVQKNHIIMLDSAPHIYGAEMRWLLTLYLSAALKEMSVLYVNRQQRQMDSISCGVFAAKDLKAIVRAGNFLEEVFVNLYQPIAFASDQALPIREYCLPPRFMYLSQSSTHLEKYLAERPECVSQPILFNPAKKPVLLLTKVSQRRFNQKSKEGKNYNQNTVYFYAKYQQSVKEQCQAPAEQKLAEVKKYDAKQQSFVLEEAFKKLSILK